MNDVYGSFQKQRCSHKIAEAVFGYAANVVFNSMIFHEALLIIIFLFVLLLIGIIKRAIYRADIVVLISNLLDNAIEAATKVKNKKIIRVKLMNEPDALIISVENTFDNILIRDDDIFETTKSTEVDLHGLGIKIL